MNEMAKKIIQLRQIQNLDGFIAINAEKGGLQIIDDIKFQSKKDEWKVTQKTLDLIIEKSPKDAVYFHVGKPFEAKKTYTDLCTSKYARDEMIILYPVQYFY